jgi:hypothetical protein
MNSSNRHHLSCGGFELYGELKTAVLEMPEGCGGEGQLDGESSVLLQFETPFDTNGVLHHIGTAGGSRAYVNPHDSGDVIASITNPHPQGVTYCASERFVQHQSDGKHNLTDNLADSSMSVDLGADRSVVPSHYCLRNGYYDALRNWELQGSNDGAEWSTLKQHQNDKSLKAERGSVAAWSVAAWPVETEQAFRHFRIQQTGLNSSNNHCLNCAWFELYGELKTAAHSMKPQPVGGQITGNNCSLSQSKQQLSAATRFDTRVTALETTVEQLQAAGCDGEA